MMDLRCVGRLQGIVDPERNTLQIKCNRRVCGATPDIVVIHTFDLGTGQLIITNRFRNPGKEPE